MTKPDFVIVWIVSRRNLHSSGTKFHVDSFCVSHDGYPTVNEWMKNEFAVKVLIDLKSDVLGYNEKESNLVSRVVWMYGHGSISQHCLRAGSSDNDLLICDEVRQQSPKISMTYPILPVGRQTM